MKTEASVSNANSTGFEIYNQPVPAGDSETRRRVKFGVPQHIEIKTRAGENPRELHRRILMEAASEAGLDGSEQQREFVERWLESGISFADAAADPSPDNGLTVQSTDLKGEWLKYKLSVDKEIADLKRLQKEYVAQGGALRPGKTYENAAGEDF